MSHQHLISPLCSPAGASRHPALHGGECEEEGGSDAVPAGAALQQRGQNVKNCNGNTSSSFFWFTSLQIIHTKSQICFPTPSWWSELPAWASSIPFSPAGASISASWTKRRRSASPSVWGRCSTPSASSWWETTSSCRPSCKINRPGEGYKTHFVPSRPPGGILRTKYVRFFF